jgi:osmoprotectant transport system ATP-binding protein
VVLVTHDIREAARLGHRITLLTAGRVVQHGTFADLAERPASPFVTQFLTAQTLSAAARPGG